MESNNQEKQQIISTTVVKTTEQKVKEFEEQLDGFKLTSEDKDELRNIYDNITEADEQNKAIHLFVKEMAGRAKSYYMKKQMNKIAPLYDTHDFWDSQPVPKIDDAVEDADYNKPIDVIKKVKDIQAEPLAIPEGFYWANINIEDDKECKEVYDLLTQNYVEDDDAMLRFDYSVKFLQWALTPPGYKKDWLFGVRGGKKNKLFGFISGIPVHLNVNGKKVTKAEINFLCVHKNLRTKRLAPVLIKEVTRRVNRSNIW